MVIKYYLEAPEPCTNLKDKTFGRTPRDCKKHLAQSESQEYGK